LRLPMAVRTASTITGCVIVVPSEVAFAVWLSAELRRV